MRLAAALVLAAGAAAADPMMTLPVCFPEEPAIEVEGTPDALADLTKARNQYREEVCRWCDQPAWPDRAKRAPVRRPAPRLRVTEACDAATPLFPDAPATPLYEGSWGATPSPVPGPSSALSLLGAVGALAAWRFWHG